MRKLAVIALLAWASVAHSQVVRREATLTSGEDRLELRDSVRVSASNFNGGSYDATVHLWVHDDYVNVLDKRLMALHRPKELTCIRGERLHVPALPRP